MHLKTDGRGEVTSAITMCQITQSAIFLSSKSWGRSECMHTQTKTKTKQVSIDHCQCQSSGENGY